MTTSDATPHWRFMAIVEVDEAHDNLADLAPREGPRFRLSPCGRSPKGYVWYELAVDGSRGESTAIRDAHVVLRALERLAIDMLRTEMRIVSGSEWLALARNLRRA